MPTLPLFGTSPNAVTLGEYSSDMLSLDSDFGAATKPGFSPPSTESKLLAAMGHFCFLINEGGPLLETLWALSDVFLEIFDLVEGLVGTDFGLRLLVQIEKCLVLVVIPFFKNFEQIDDLTFTKLGTAYRFLSMVFTLTDPLEQSQPLYLELDSVVIIVKLVRRLMKGFDSIRSGFSEGSRQSKQGASYESSLITENILDLIISKSIPTTKMFLFFADQVIKHPDAALVHFFGQLLHRLERLYAYCNENHHAPPILQSQRPALKLKFEAFIARFVVKYPSCDPRPFQGVFERMFGHADITVVCPLHSTRKQPIIEQSLGIENPQLHLQHLLDLLLLHKQNLAQSKPPVADYSVIVQLFDPPEPSPSLENFSNHHLRLAVPQPSEIPSLQPSSCDHEPKKNRRIFDKLFRRTPRQKDVQCRKCRFVPWHRHKFT